MKPGGIHLLLTYKCNASCGHCFLSCGPSRDGVIPIEDTRKYIAGAGSAGYISHFFIEGGEPFLYPGLLAATVAEIKAAGYWLGLLTNGFWAVSDSRAREMLEPLAAAGLDYVGISTDTWHESFVPPELAERAALAAQETGIETDLMVCSAGSGDAHEAPAAGPGHKPVIDRLRRQGLEAYSSPVICRGRAAASRECSIRAHPWEKLKKCGSTFGGKSRIHLGPGGQIHLCQGLLLGSDARSRPLPEIFEAFKVKNHPVCRALDRGGPAALARLAAGYGFVPEDAYADGCQLCFEARRFLMPRFPDLIGPAEMYEAARPAPA
ncbi:MAG: radical SAM protein [Thermoleophilia bacterium]|nr:radical SAM protein [Thermoleophilia bacterium]